MQKRANVTIRRLVLALSLLAALSLPTGARAQIPVIVEVGSQQGSPTEPDPQAGDGPTSLPHTGLEVLALVAAGVALVGAGSTMHQAARMKEEEGKDG